jgi:hypothetical protein
MPNLKQLPVLAIVAVVLAGALIGYAIARGTSNSHNTESSLATLAPKVTLAPDVQFVSPLNGDTVSNPITARMAVAGVLLEPASTTPAPLHTHMHVIVDGAVPPAGQVMPTDDTHIDLADGGHVVTLPPLSPGAHTLTVFLTDSTHVIPGRLVSQTITINVAQ